MIRGGCLGELIRLYFSDTKLLNVERGEKYVSNVMLVIISLMCNILLGKKLLGSLRVSLQPLVLGESLPLRDQKSFDFRIQFFILL